MKLYLKIFYMCFYVLLFISISVFIPVDNLISEPEEHSIRNMDLGVETSDKVSDISSFWDVSSPFFFDKKDVGVNELAGDEVNYLLSVEDSFYDETVDGYNQYLQIRDYSLSLIKSYQSILSSKDIVFVTIGASSTPIQAFVEGIQQLSSSGRVKIDPSIEEIINTTEFINMPFSRALIEKKSVLPEKLRQSSRLSSEQIYKAYFKFFDKYFKGPSIFRDKNIVIMDFTMTARSLFSFSRLFLRYLHFKSILYNSVHIHLIRIFNDNAFIKKMAQLDNIHVSNIARTYPILAFNLLRSNFEEYRQYPESYIDKIHEENPVEVSEKYKAFIKTLMKYMKKDALIRGGNCPSLFGSWF